MKVLCINDRMRPHWLRRTGGAVWPLKAGQVYEVVGEIKCTCHSEFVLSISEPHRTRRVPFCRKCKHPITGLIGRLAFRKDRFIPFPDDPKVSIEEVKELYEPAGTIQAREANH